MLKTNNTKLKKSKIPLLLIPISLSGIFLYQYLTFIPEYSQAYTIEETIMPIKTLADITYMSELTPEICGNTKTPSAFLADNTTINPNVPTKQLIDDREGSKSTKYWVAKLADGNCWMTQNMAYSGISDTSGNFNSTKSQILLVPKETDSAPYYTELSTADMVESMDPSMTVAVNGNTYNAHYLLGTFYTIDNDQSANACYFTKNKSWQVPASHNSVENTNIQASYEQLFNTYNIANNAEGSMILRNAPFYYIFGGYSYSGIWDIGNHAGYWSSTTSNGLYYDLFINNEKIDPRDTNSSADGCSVRCLVVGAEATAKPQILNPNISVNIPEIITLDVYTDSENEDDSKTVNISPSSNGGGTGEFTAKVSSNSKYSLSLSIVENGHTDLRNDNTNINASIPALDSTVGITTNSNNWWGIKCTNETGSTNCLKTSYTGLALTPETYFTSSTSTPKDGTETPFTIGIQTSPDLPSGTYTTDILVTAATSD